MRYLSEIFWRGSQDVSTLVPNNSEFLVCLSVCQLAYFLTEIRKIQGYLQFCVIYLSETFWRHSQDIPTLVTNIFNFFVFMSVCQLAQCLTEIRKIQGYLKFCMIYLSEFFGDISGMLVHYFQIILNLMFVCQSVCLLTSLPKLDKGISPDLDETSFWNFLKTFLTHWHTGSK